MNGVIAGGPGAIAWGWAYGVPAQVWTTADGVAWDPATIPFPADADPEYQEPGAITSITAWGGGYVATGFYSRLETGRRTLVWTSSDGRTWTPVPHNPVFEIGIMDNLVACVEAAGLRSRAGGRDGRWRRGPTLVLFRRHHLEGRDAAPSRRPDDGLRGCDGRPPVGNGATSGVDTAGDGESVILTSTDGRT